jgi:hypothetical protein
MTMNKTLTLMVAVAAVVTVGSVLAVAKQTAPPAEPATEQAPVNQLSPAQVQQQQAAVIAAAGRGVLQRIEAAYELIAADKTDEAAKAMAVAQQLLGQIGLALKEDGADPTETADEGLSIPIYASLGISEEDDMTPALQQELEGVSPLIARGDHEAVVERLKRLQVTLTYRYVEMPLAKVGAEVDAAAKALQAGDKDGARAFLKAAAEATVSASVTVGADKEQG